MAGKSTNSGVLSPQGVADVQALKKAATGNQLELPSEELLGEVPAIDIGEPSTAPRQEVIVERPATDKLGASSSDEPPQVFRAPEGGRKAPAAEPEQTQTMDDVNRKLLQALGSSTESTPVDVMNTQEQAANILMPQPTSGFSVDALGGRDLYNTKGRPLTNQQALDLMIQEERAAREAAQRPGVFDHTNYDALSANFKNIVHEANIGQVQAVAADVTENLNYATANIADSRILNHTRDTRTGVQTGLDLLNEAFGTSSEATIGAVTNAIAAVSTEIVSGKINTDLQEEMDGGDPFSDADSVYGYDFGEEAVVTPEDETASREDPENPVLLSNGMKKDSVKRRLASAMAKYLKNQDIAAGGKGRNVRGVNKEIVGDLLEEVAIGTGMFNLARDNNGEMYVLATEKANRFSQATREMVNQTINDRKDSRRAKTPANLATGFYNSWNKSQDVRDRFISRYNADKMFVDGKLKGGTLQDITDFAVKLGSVPYTTSKNQVAANALLSVLAGNGNEIAKKFLGTGKSRLDRIRDTAGGGQRGERAVQAEIEKTVNKFNNSVLTYSQIFNSSPEYNYHKADPTVWRWYPENLSVEMQNNLTNRSLGNNPVANYINVTDADIAAISGEEWQTKSEDYFEKNFDKGGKIQDDRMALLSNLAAAYSAIKGKEAEILSWKELVSRLNMGFIQESASVGRELRSVFNKLGIANQDGSINLDKLKEYALVKPNQRTNATIQLTPNEQKAIEQWLSVSSKKTYGFTANSFIELANLADILNNNRQPNAMKARWNPKITLDIDMNSAGRTFLAMDIGNIDVLKRTGVLYDSSWKTLGSPRKHYAQQIHLTATNAKQAPFLFKNSNAHLESEKIQLGITFGKLLKDLEASRPDFIDDLAKKVLLTDDYGKYMFAHAEEAMALVDQYPEIEQTLGSYYEKRMDLIEDIAQLYGKTLANESSQFNKELPKSITRLLQYFGRFPEFQLFFGEKSHIGSEAYVELEDGPETKVSINGKGFSYKPTEKVKNTIQAAKSKQVFSTKEGRLIHHNPEMGSAAINQIGPLLGQYRESATLMTAVNMVNPDKTKTPNWFAIVHDNLIIDGNGFANYFFAVNSIKKGAARKVLNMDVMNSMVTDFEHQLGEINKEFTRLKDSNASIDIGRNGKFAGIGARADDLYKRIKSWDQETEGLKGEDENSYANNRKKVLLSELAMYEKMGWINPDQRTGDFKNFKIKARELLKKQFTVSRFLKLPGNKGLTFENREGLNYLQALVYIHGIFEGARQFKPVAPNLKALAKSNAYEDRRNTLDKIDKQVKVNKTMRFV